MPPVDKAVGPSLHLSWAELACHDAAKTPYPAEWRENRAIELARAFERVREICGFPLIVNSGYRTKAYNSSIGGARQSQHVEGRALDLVPTGAIRVTGRRSRLKILADAARQAREEGLLTGIGIYNGFVHIDTRYGPAASWTGSRMAE